MVAGASGRVAPPASAWLQAVEARSPRLVQALAPIYGSRDGALARLPLVERALRTFCASFGDAAVRVVRCPARINLRGMHVDTHGGYLNLMTHQRETVVVSAVSDRDWRFVNADISFAPVTVEADVPQAISSWSAHIARTDVQQRTAKRRGEWGNYVEGAVVRALYADAGATPIRAAVAGDIPAGASLSSSTSLSLAILLSILAWNETAGDVEQLVEAARDIEWYAGARIGTSDQAAMLLPGPNELVTFAPTDSGALLDLRRLSFPRELAVLVIDSCTTRSLSGAEQVEYTRNRFAYSLALEILRQELARDRRVGAVASMDRLGTYTADTIAGIGGVATLYGALTRVPLRATLDTLRDRYTLPDLDATYARYFGVLPERERPTRFDVRGPLIFGLAESERARIFRDTLACGNFAEAGRLMSIGHDGDRQVTARGEPYMCDVSDAALREYAARETPIHDVPGAYGAGTPALDALADRAVGAGALGASLTGAGLGGTVVALCTADGAERVEQTMRDYVCSGDYRRLLEHVRGRVERPAAEVVVRNDAPAPAGELPAAF